LQVGPHKHFLFLSLSLNHLPEIAPKRPPPACYTGRMSSPAQILANRANAQESTGPRSAEGKAASRFNALKHGLDARSIVLPGEDPEEYAALARI
jgi:hypothetical protein